MLRKFVLSLAAAAMLVVPAIPAQAIGLSATRALGSVAALPAIEFSERAKLSYQLFCLQYGNECRTGSKSVVSYTSRLRTRLSSVNRAVNRIMPQLQARRDFLSLQPISSRGHDHAVVKRSRLIDAGVPAGALRIATIRADGGRPHAVLIVATTAGDYVLDQHKGSVVRRRGSEDVSAVFVPSRFGD